MPISAEWDDPEHRTIYYHIIAPWTWDEMEAAFQEGTAMVESVAHLVDFIFEFEGILPERIFAEANRYFSRYHERSGVQVIIGTNRLIRLVFNVLRRMGHPLAGKIRLVSSREEARALLASIREQANS